MGTHFWGYETDDLIPDIVTMGKPMGNGHPMAATVMRAELVDEFSGHAHYFNTFGGNPVSCAAGMAVLEVIEKEKLQQNALEVGRYLGDGLSELATRHDAIGDVRGSGFFACVELVTDRESRNPATELTARVTNGLRERQVLAGSIGRDANILKLRPPMVFTKENADHFLNVLDDVLGA
jgi:4-aminobutyrate aminotransferase-like enzyme